MRASFNNGYSGGNLQLSAATQHPLKSRENSPELQFPRQSEQPIRTLSPVPTLVHTPRLEYGSSSPPPSTQNSPDDINTPPTTALSSPARSVLGGHHYRQLSEHGTSYAPSPTPSNLSFEVLSGYSSMTPAEKVRQHQRDVFYQQPPQIWEREESPPIPIGDEGHFAGQFKPNADLPFLISEGLRRYYPHAHTHDVYIGEREGSLRRSNGPTEFFERFNTLTNDAKQRLGGSNRGSLHREQMLLEETDDDGQQQEYSVHQDSSVSRTGIDEMEGSRLTSGIPSYTREFNMRWRGMFPLLLFCSLVGSMVRSCHIIQALTLKDPIRSAASAVSAASSIRRVAQSTPAHSTIVVPQSYKKEDNILAAYIHEILSQIDAILRKVKRPLCFVLIVGVLGFLISFIVTSLAMPFLCANPGFASISHCQIYLHSTHGSVSQSYINTTYPDFPTLMSIESSFEKIVDGAAGGSALARAMKSSEMAVSDLSTVVRYSDLKCKESLSSKLDAFATDAKASVRALSGWGSKVGGVLDQCGVLHLILPFLSSIE